MKTATAINLDKYEAIVMVRSLISKYKGDDEGLVDVMSEVLLYQERRIEELKHKVVASEEAYIEMLSSVVNIIKD